MPESARNLERYDSHDSSNASFFSPEDSREGELPGAIKTRPSNTGQIRKMVTGTTSKEDKSKKADRFARMEQERYRNDDRSNEYESDRYERNGYNSGRQSSGQQQLNTDTMEHNF